MNTLIRRRDRCITVSPPVSLDRFHERELNELKAVTVHSELATAAALDYCAKEEICPPPWVVKKAAELMCDLLKREKAERRGRTAGRIARYRQDLWDRLASTPFSRFADLETELGVTWKSLDRLDESFRNESVMNT